MTTKAIEAGARASLAALKEWDDLEGPLGVYDLGYHAKEVVVDPHAVRDFRPGENGRIVARFATHEEAMAEYELLTAKHYAKACIEAAIASGELVPASAMAAERERCAKVADRMAWSHSNTHMMGPEQNCVRVAEAIRALEPANGEFVLGWQDIETEARSEER